MPQITLHNAGGEALETIELDEAVFGAEVREDLVHAAVVAQLAAKRAGTHKAKTRGEVSGGGRKPYRQKGTGRARQGSIRAPQWVGGGNVFPPTPRDYSQRLPRKQRRRALVSVWSDHVANESLLVIDGLSLDAPKTKLAAEAMRAVLAPTAEKLAAAVEPPADRDESDPRPVRRRKERRRVLVLAGPDEIEPLQQAFANLKTIEFDDDRKVTLVCVIRLQRAPYASVYDLALADVVVATRAAIDRITAEFGGEVAA